MLLVMNPETYLGNFGLNWFLWTISDSCLGLVDGGISVLLGLSENH